VSENGKENGTNGKDARGLYLPGNKFGKGNPHNGTVQRFRAKWLECVKEEDVAEAYRTIMAVMLDRDPETGESIGTPVHVRLAAAQMFLDRTIGKPKDQIELKGDVAESVEKVRAGIRALSARMNVEDIDLS